MGLERATGGNSAISWNYKCLRGTLFVAYAVANIVNRNWVATCPGYYMCEAETGVLATVTRHRRAGIAP